MSIETPFQKELEILINQYSLENKSNTPDYILAQYLDDCLKAFNKATNNRAKHYGIYVKPKTTKIVSQ